MIAMREIEVELSVLGSMLCNEKFFHHCVSRLKEDDFLNRSHRELFKFLKSHFEKGKSFEELLLTIPEELQNVAEYAVEFALSSETLFHAVVSRFIENYKKRREAEIASQLARGEITREEALALLSDLERDRKNQGGNIESVALKWVQKQEEQINSPRVQGISTGSFEIDRIFTLRKELTLICARPSIGKTMTALALLYNQAQMGIKVQFFSLELTEDEVMARLVSIHTGRTLKEIVYGWVKFEEIVKAADELSKLPIYIEPGPLTLPQIKAKIYEVNPEVVYIDYIQKIREHSKEHRNRKEFLDYVSAELLEIAKSHCPIVALAQLNRKTRMGKDEPTIENIKETGNFEQDASNILLLHRNLKEIPDKLQIRVAKCRVDAANREIVVDFVNGIPRFRSPIGEEEITQEEQDYEWLEF